MSEIEKELDTAQYAASCECGGHYPQLEQMYHELQAKLKAAEEDRDCWITNAKNLQKGYNELDTRIRKSQEQEPFDWDCLDAYLTLHGAYPKLYRLPEPLATPRERKE